MELPLRKAFRSRRNYWAALFSEIGRPVLRSWSKGLAKGPCSRPRDWRKALLIGASHIGDILYLTGSIKALARGLPECRLHIVSCVPASEAVECNCEIEKVHRFELPRTRRSAEFEILKAEGFDAAICYDSGMYFRPLRLAVALGIPNRAGYVHKGFSGWVTHPILIQYPKPYPAYFRDFVAQLSGRPPTWSLRPVVGTCEADKREAAERRRMLGLGANRRIVACFVSTRQPTGVWPRDYFAQLIRLLEARGIDVVLCGAASDRESLEALRRENRIEAPVLAGELGLRALVEFLRGCPAVICPDSGPRHLANAAGVPVFFFRNLRSSRVETGKYCETEHDFAPDAEFVAPERQGPYLQQRKAEQVMAAIDEVIH
jgi:ADP-heptose:LPS heptosyltransferase